ncbi:MAG: alpha/beta hydrolase [Gemmatimonadales bacterium]
MLPILLTLALQLPQPTAIVVAPGETLTVRVTGIGAPVVLIPGLFGSVQGFSRLTDNLTALGYRVIAIEPLGIGNSSRPRGADYTQTAQAARVATILDTLGVGQSLIVAHSAGATIAYRLALMHPDRVRGVISIEGGPTEQVGSAGARRALSLAPLLRVMGRGATRGRVAGQLREASGQPDWVTDSVVHVYTAGASVDYGATLRALGAMMDAVEPWPLLPALEGLTVPVTLVLGTAPHLGGPDAQTIALMERAIPRLGIERLDGVGHYAFEEDPSALAQLVRRVDLRTVAVR